MNGSTIPITKLPQTPVNVIYLVVLTLSAVALIGVTALAGTLYFKNYADPVVLSNFTNITIFCVGAVAGILSNTRQQSEAVKEMKASIKPEKYEPPNSNNRKRKHSGRRRR